MVTSNFYVAKKKTMTSSTTDNNREEDGADAVVGNIVTGSIGGSSDGHRLPQDSCCRVKMMEQPREPIRY